MHESLYLVFVDYEKAFDRLKHEYIWCALQRKGVPDNIVTLIKAQYEAFECRISHDGILSDAIQTDAGVRQGCIMSPLLFLVVIDEILTTSIDNAGKRGILWQPISMEHLEDLDFADDIVLFSQRKSDMQSKLNDLVKHSSAAGLKINAKKTKHLAVHTNDAFYNIGEENIENVNVFQYLGSQFTAESGCKSDVSARLQKARGAFANLRTVWQSKQIHITTKIRIFNSNVKSVLLYACETWCLSAEIVQKLQVFVNRCLRRILRIWWPDNWISNTELHRRCHQKPIANEVRERKWRWLGHTLRKGGNEISRQALDWNPQGQRRRGRPRGSWRRCIEQEYKAVAKTMTWQQVKNKSGDRTKWKNFTLALCSATENKE